MPVWHASLSLQHRGAFLRSPGRLERAAVRLLAEVGDDREWWFWNPAAHVGHLRVAVTVQENDLIPPGLASVDAGVTGPQRRRRS